MYEFYLIAAGVIFTGIIERIIKAHMKRWELKDKAEAEKTLAAHGYSTALYMPSVGQPNKELKRAMDRLSAERIILDRHGNVIGRILSETGQEPRLRLVVDNTK